MKNFLEDYVIWICGFCIIFVIWGIVAVALNGGK